MITTLHSAELNGFKVRFFRSPREGADMPYVSVLDLLSATRLPVKDRKLYMDNLPREFPEEVDTFAVAEEVATTIVRVCTHGMAMGIVGIGQHIGSADIDMAYRLAALEALNKVVAELRLGEQEAFDYSLRAVMRCPPSTPATGSGSPFTCTRGASGTSPTPRATSWLAALPAYRSCSAKPNGSSCPCLTETRRDRRKLQREEAPQGRRTAARL